jgi:hypothetical protein
MSGVRSLGTWTRRVARTGAFRLAAAAVAVAIALVAALLAQDVRSSHQTLQADAARYSASHSAEEQWTASTILPASVSARLLATARDRRWLSALRFFALAHAVPLTDAGIAPPGEQLLQTAEQALGRVVGDPNRAAASQAYNLTGVLLFTDSKATLVPDVAAYEAAVAALQNAVRADPGNTQAKVNLELLLRQQRSDFVQQPETSNRNARNSGHIVGRGKGVPPLKAPGGDY